MNFFALTGLATAVSSVCFSLFTLLKGRKPLHRIWVIFNLTVALWGFCAFKFSTTLDKNSAFFWLYVGHIGVTLIPVLYFHFVLVLLALRKPLTLAVVYAVGFSFFTLNLLDFSGVTELFIVSLRFVFNEFYVDSPPGPTYPFFVAFFFYLVGYAHWLALREVRAAEGTRRVQIRYFLWAMAPAFYGGGTAFLMVFGLPIYPFAHATVPFYPIVMTYAIVRHQLLDIEVVVKRTVQFAGLVGAVVGVVSLVAFVSQDVLARFIEVPKWLSNVLAAAIIAVAYGRIRGWLIEVTDRYLFQKQYDYKELLRKFTDEVMVVVDLKQLVQMTVGTLTDVVKLNSCSLLLLNKDSRTYELIAAQGLNGQHAALDEHEPFVTFLRKTHEPIGRDGVLGRVEFPAAVTQRLEQLQARLCLPLNLHDELIGVLCLGQKKSDEEFTKDDLDILLPLARTLAIAVSNAQLFDELAKTQAEAAQKEKLAVIGTLSAGINHEICNPLGIVKAQCEAFLLDAEDGILVGKSAQELLERSSTIMRGALKQIDRATAITQKLSNFSKPIKEAVAQPVSVADEVDEVLMLVGHDLKLEKITLEKEMQPDLPQILADRRQLQEVLFNLIRNAGQAITPPGAITIRTAEVGGRVRIAIIDTGSGIPAEHLEKIWNPFFTTKEPGKGTGLGLFIVRQIVERNKGRINVESTVGVGTTFTLEFPVASKELAGALAGATKEQA